MRFLKTILLIIGLIAVLVAAFLLAQQYVYMVSLSAAANSQNSANPPRYPNPFANVAVVAGVGLLGGFLLGYGLGLPKRTAASIREEALDAATAQRQATIASRATEKGTDK